MAARRGSVDPIVLLGEGRLNTTIRRRKAEQLEEVSLIWFYEPHRRVRKGPGERATNSRRIHPCIDSSHESKSILWPSYQKLFRHKHCTSGSSSAHHPPPPSPSHFVRDANLEGTILHGETCTTETLFCALLSLCRQRTKSLVELSIKAIRVFTFHHHENMVFCSTCFSTCCFTGMGTCAVIMSAPIPCRLSHRCTMSASTERTP